MVSVFLALGSSVAWGVSDFLAGVESRRRSLLVVLLISQAAAVSAVFALYWVISREGIYSATLGAGLGCGLLLLASMACFYKALSLGPIGVVAPIMACSAGVPIGAGVLLGDPVSNVQWAGIAACLGGGVLTVAEPRGRIRPLPILLALTGMGAFGVFLVLFNRATELTFAPVLLVTRATVLFVVACAVILLRTTVRMTRREIPSVAAVGLLDVLSMVLFALAGRDGALGVISVVASLYPVVTVLMAWSLLNEHLPISRRVGASIVLGGVCLLALG